MARRSANGGASTPAVAWATFSPDRRRAVLQKWVGEWKISWDRTDPLPAGLAAVKVLAKNGNDVIAELQRPTLTSGELKSVQAADALCERAARDLRELAFRRRLRDATRAIDRQLVYLPACPDHSHEDNELVLQRRKALASMRELRSSTDVCRARWALDFQRLGLDRPVDVDRLEWVAVQIAAFGRLLKDLAVRPEPLRKKRGQKPNRATRELLANVHAIELPKKLAAAVKREIATIIAEDFNLHIGEEGAVRHLFNLERERATRDKLIDEGKRPTDDYCETEREHICKPKRRSACAAWRETRRAERVDAIEKWLTHFRSIKAKPPHRSDAPSAAN